MTHGVNADVRIKENIMPKDPNKQADKFKIIDQMLEDFAGDEFDDYESNYNDVSKNHKHYSADEDAIASIDDLY